MVELPRIRPDFDRDCLRFSGKNAIAYHTDFNQRHPEGNPEGLPFTPVHIRIDFPMP